MRLDPAFISTVSQRDLMDLESRLECRIENGLSERERGEGDMEGEVGINPYREI